MKKLILAVSVFCLLLTSVFAEPLIFFTVPQDGVTSFSFNANGATMANTLVNPPVGKNWADVHEMGILWMFPNNAPWGVFETTPISLTYGNVSNFTVNMIGSGVNYNGTSVSFTISPSLAGSLKLNAYAVIDNVKYYFDTTKVIGNYDGAPMTKLMDLQNWDWATQSPIAPQIVQQPTSQTLYPGEIATFTVVATGSGSLSYEWAKNGEKLDGASSSSLNVFYSSAVNGDKYRCIVTNSAGTITSNEVELTVVAIPGKPTITQQPTTNTVVLGNQAVFMVSATGNGTLSYQWFKNGAEIIGRTTSTLVITNSQLSDAGLYYCSITNKTGAGVMWENSIEVSLIVNEAANAPQITTQPSDILAIAGESKVIFTVVATGNGVLTYQWAKGENNIAGATSSTLAFPNVHLDDAGQYSCAVTNTVGTSELSVMSNKANLTVVSPIIITQQPVNQTVTIEQDAVFTIAATGPGTLSYQWYWDSVQIPGATSSTLTINHVEYKAAPSTVYCVVSNQYQGVGSNSATLTTTPPAETTPTIELVSPSRAINLGDTITLSVIASGGNLQYLWLRNGIPIAGTANPDLTITNAVLRDGAQYQCFVWNSSHPLGTMTQIIYVTVLTPQ